MNHLSFSLSILACVATTAVLACSSTSDVANDSESTTSALGAAPTGTATATPHDKCDDWNACMTEGLAICKARCIALFPIDGEDRARCSLACDRNQAEYCSNRYPMTMQEKLDCFERMSKPKHEP